MKASTKALAMMLPFLLMESEGFGELPKHELTEEDKEYLRKLKAEKEFERKIKSGLKPFDFNGQIVWALNEKNAVRKYNKSINTGS
jgi:hypothetical protein